ncbi:acyltransferase domain-containing protein [Streptomyces sp. NPDC006307]|uniref:acyltransferase domain-containing protein n=1 Tax=Streptomyces sp. NPDC006307 TaxID=3156748 RepID=UPI0033AFBFFB
MRVRRRARQVHAGLSARRRHDGGRSGRGGGAPLPGGAGDRVAVAAVNGPAAIVVAGDADAVGRVAAAWEARGRRTTRLPVSHAFHSPHMDHALDELRAVAEDLAYHPPTVPVVSHLFGEPATAEQLTSPEYWVAHVRQPVRFLDAVRRLHDDGVTGYLELGPDAVLTAMVPACLPQGADQAVATAATRKGRAEDRTLPAAPAELHVQGLGVDWRAPFEGRGATHVELPTYAFQRKRYWLDRQNRSVPAQRRRSGGPDRSAGWRYREAWRHHAPPATGHRPVTGVWPLLLPAAGVDGETEFRLSRAIERAGGRALPIRLGSGDADRAGLTELLRRRLPGREDLAGFLSLLGLDTTSRTAPSATASPSPSASHRRWPTWTSPHPCGVPPAARWRSTPPKALPSPRRRCSGAWAAPWLWNDRTAGAASSTSPPPSTTRRRCGSPPR